MAGYSMEWIFYGSAILTAAAGAVCDWNTHKIPNKLTGFFMLAGLVLHMAVNGLAGLLDSTCGILAGFVLIICFMAGALKAGDVKLYMAVGACGGWQFCLKTIIYSILIGGIAGLVVMLIRKNGRKSFRRLAQYLASLFWLKTFYPYRPETEDGYFCFGVCIAAGALTALLWR